jgi:hypothetical protein
MARIKRSRHLDRVATGAGVAHRATRLLYWRERFWVGDQSVYAARGPEAFADVLHDLEHLLKARGPRSPVPDHSRGARLAVALLEQSCPAPEADVIDEF